MTEPFDTGAFLQTFIAEARERIARMNQGLLDLEASPNDREAWRRVMREAHTLKGAARMIGLDPIGALAHRMEDILVAGDQQGAPLEPEIVDVLFAGLDALGGLVDAAALGAVAPDTGTLEERLRAAALALGGAESRSAPVEASPTPAEPAPPRAGDQSIRVALEKLDQMANLTVEMAIGRMRAAQARTVLAEAVALARGTGRRWLRVRPAVHDPETAEALREIEVAERRMGGLLAQAWEELQQVRFHQDFLAEEVRRQVLAIRMQPLAVVFDAFPRAVRDLARQCGKDVNLVIEGGDVELDKRIIEEVAEPLLHLVRNAIDHGLETPEARQAAGKPRRASLGIAARALGNRVTIEVADDGAGMNPAALREAAVRKGVLSAQEALALSDAEALELIFRPGFTTTGTVTDVSGRGVGMDVVRATVQRLKGTGEVESRPGEGTRVRIGLPVSLSMLPVLLVRAAGRTYGLPASTAERIITVRSEGVLQLEGQRAVRREAETIPFAALSDLVGQGAAAEAGPLPGVVIRAGARKLAVGVSQVLDQGEVVLKDLGPFLGQVEMVMGSTVLGTGEVVLILDPAALVRQARGRGVPAAARAPISAAAQGRRILLVEDSLIARDLERTILEAAGYTVVPAVDGLEALEKLSQQDFDLVVTDIEMPRMDGLDLTARLRGDARHRDLPVVIVTNRERPEDRRRGMELGADAYILKSAFNQSSLLETIARLVGRPGGPGPEPPPQPDADPGLTPRP